jgi:antitoxin MazE
MTRAIIGRWGSSLAVRLPVELAASLNLREGERIELDSSADQIVIRRTKPRYTLEEMFAGKRDDEWRALYADAFDWGPDVGREIVED